MQKIWDQHYVEVNFWQGTKIWTSLKYFGTCRRTRHWLLPQTSQEWNKFLPQHKRSQELTVQIYTLCKTRKAQVHIELWSGNHFKIWISASTFSPNYEFCQWSTMTLRHLYILPRLCKELPKIGPNIFCYSRANLHIAAYFSAMLWSMSCNQTWIVA